MDTSSRKLEERDDRNSAGQHGLARFEVTGLDADRNLICSLARRLAEPGAESAALRKAITAVIDTKPPASDNRPSKRGGILAALRSSPLVGAGLDLTKIRHSGRTIDL
ncbi:hypothetical protein ACIQW5_22015 [Methylorubrum thiocyanatum]|uniref:hypothetical protein n=1 Tax=Methylorubrum thiocyanatum TaxID=47958 RepID=UPI00383B2E83